MYDSVIIGAGVTGSAIARELSRFSGEFLLIEKNDDVCTGTSKANSAIIHAGFDAANGSLMAKFNVLGNSMMDEVAKELDVPFRRNGAMVLCFEEENLPRLRDLYERGVKNGVPELKILTGDEAREIEPELNENVCGALYAPTSGIVCPFELTLGFAENAADNGVEFRFGSGVTGIEKTSEGFVITLENGDKVETKTVINAAGVYSDNIHNMVCEDKIEIIPRRGEYIICDKAVGGLVDSTLFQLPTAYGKGILVSPTIHGNLLLGPTAEDSDDKEGIDTSAGGLADVMKFAALSVKTLPSRQAITSFSGLRAHSPKHEFILGEQSVEGFFDAAAIESPGLSSSPAIGRFIAEEVAKKLCAEKKADFNPIRKGLVKPNEMSFEERAELIAKEPAYGQIICRCETVSEGEIVASINRTLGARTLDGVKRRTRAGMGRCQSGFCSPKVMEILARELNMNLDDVRKNEKGSYIVLEKTNKGIN
ncbi:MAG: NAD(P)/FAD-dependent oxidoreductase [Clostridia bacterium]|nr:NAD(P)/FAD-dependent oxidoreductase [Clostridia bacterium]